MSDKKGVYVTTKLNGEVSYRASLTYRGKHIALGSFGTCEQAAEAYEIGMEVLTNPEIRIEDYVREFALPFDKFIVLINFRDNKMYLPNPIYVRKRYISYYLEEKKELKFSKDDLFYYMSHRILKKGGHLYVNDYGMQVSLGTRYGIKRYAKSGVDYKFVNGDEYDYRYENIEILNMYNGVKYVEGAKKHGYCTKIHEGSDLVVGYYEDAVYAAIAYNKAADTLKKHGIECEYVLNYIEGLSPKAYADIYSEIELSKNVLERRKQ